MDEFVTIKTYTYPSEAAIIRGRMEAEGIRCLLKDEATIGANPFLSNAVGGVKLQVRIEDAGRATAILNEWDAATRDEAADEVTITLHGKHAVPEHCPYCHSDEIAKQNKVSGALFGISVFLFGFPIPGFRKEYHCYNCARNFKVKWE